MGSYECDFRKTCWAFAPHITLLDPLLDTMRLALLGEWLAATIPERHSSPSRALNKTVLRPFLCKDHTCLLINRKKRYVVMHAVSLVEFAPILAPVTSGAKLFQETFQRMARRICGFCEGHSGASEIRVVSCARMPSA
ncbi:hypothetical protein QBC46DRAFT_411909 [Diplogelasinospora grovesii]|uniref:Uncharacterized protein n=1 Tax=Diplogelasinospora grovesii TaxID=303347 RepID=A0AAN6S1R8_9PEZI|nr:hypothetical protein QBC46DRAFT_411909 [Diplogelasinospora grovesii]